MPRTPKEAGLIGVALKRKKEYKNTHQHQLINPEKLFKMLDKLKRCKNPYYQFYDDYSEYQGRCKKTDPAGYNVVFHDDDNVEQMNDIADEINKVVNDYQDIDHNEKTVKKMKKVK